MISDIELNTNISNKSNNLIISNNQNISNNLVSVTNSVTNSVTDNQQLYKMLEENKIKYDELRNNINTLDEIIQELENKSSKILKEITYLEKIYNDSLILFVNITKNN
jgi:predicted nuclease with TOPRIM domain